MIFSTSNADDGRRFLAGLEALIAPEELSRFSLEAGFADPNNFPFGHVANVLKSHAFPASELVEYGWAIKECGSECLKRYSPPMRLFAASIYLYCYKVTGFDANFQGEFLYLLVKDEPASDRPVGTSLLLVFLEWMIDHVASHRAYSEYDLLLAWSLTAIRRRKTGEPVFALVHLHLRQLGYSATDLRLNNDSVFPQPGDWLDLLQEIPVGDAEVDAMLPIMCGYD